MPSFMRRLDRERIAAGVGWAADCDEVMGGLCGCCGACTVTGEVVLAVRRGFGVR